MIAFVELHKMRNASEYQVHSVCNLVSNNQILVGQSRG